MAFNQSCKNDASFQYWEVIVRRNKSGNSNLKIFKKHRNFQINLQRLNLSSFFLILKFSTFTLQLFSKYQKRLIVSQIFFKKTMLPIRQISYWTEFLVDCHSWGGFWTKNGAIKNSSIRVLYLKISTKFLDLINGQFVGPYKRTDLLNGQFWDLINGHFFYYITCIRLFLISGHSWALSYKTGPYKLTPHYFSTLAFNHISIQIGKWVCHIYRRRSLPICIRLEALPCMSRYGSTGSISVNFSNLLNFIDDGW